MMTTKTATISSASRKEQGVTRLVSLMTTTAWTLLGIGILLSLINVNQFNDHNSSLMVGIGFMIASVHVYVIRTAIHLVHSRNQDEDGGKL